MKTINTLLAALILLAIVTAATACDQSAGGNQTVVTANNATSQTTASSPEVAWPIVSGVPSDSDMAAIKDTMNRIYKAEVNAAFSFDLSQFPTVFADDSDVPPAAWQSSYIQQVRQAEGGAVAQALNGNGWLSYQMAWYLNWKRGADGLDRVEAQAAARGQAGVTNSDLATITGVVGSPMPRNRRENYSADVINNPYYNYQEIKASGNWADITYHTRMALQRSFLVKTANGWKEAGRIVLHLPSQPPRPRNLINQQQHSQQCQHHAGD